MSRQRDVPLLDRIVRAPFQCRVVFSIRQPGNFVKSPLGTLVLQHPVNGLGDHLGVDVNEVFPLVKAGLLENARAVRREPDRGL